MKIHFYRILKNKFKIVAIATILFCSCENDIATVQSLTAKDNVPDESAKDVTIIRSDSAKVEFVLESPTLHKFYKQEIYTEFPDGIKISTYDSNRDLINTLTSNWAINNESKKMMEAKSNVVITNRQTNEVIETEHIVWDQQNKTIYSNVFIKRTNEEGVMYGDGFDADESFSRYTIRNPRATLYVNEE
jgi:LPS export ABC transporter protein LptC